MYATEKVGQLPRSPWLSQVFTTSEQSKSQFSMQNAVQCQLLHVNTVTQYDMEVKR